MESMRRRRPRRSEPVSACDCGCERCRQEHDAEVRVAARRSERGLDRAQDALAHFGVRYGDAGGGRGRARLEVVGLHAVPAGMDVDVARLQGDELGAAGGEEGLACLALAQARHCARL